MQKNLPEKWNHFDGIEKIDFINLDALPKNLTQVAIKKVNI